MSIWLKRQVREQRLGIREKSANIENTDVRQSDVRPEIFEISFQIIRFQTEYISMLSFIQTQRNQLSPASFWLAVHPFFQERSCVLQSFFLSVFVFLLFHTAEEVQHITFIPSDSHRGFYFPPGRPLWQPADDQIVQTFRPEACGAYFQTTRTQNICMLSYALTYKILLSTIRWNGWIRDKGLSLLPASLYKRKFGEFYMNGGPGLN